MRGIDLLKRALEGIPVPSGPAMSSGEGSEIGLSFLDTSQRLNHVRRITEKIGVRQHGVITKTTEVDVSLGMLDASQRSASDQFNSLNTRTRIPDDASGLLWVPIARLPQSSSSPLEITNAQGNQLSRLTQYDTSRLIAAGLYRLVRSILQAQSAGIAGRDTRLLLSDVEEARWLLESSIYSLLTARGRPPDSVDQAPTPGTAGGVNRKIKDFLLGVVDHQEKNLAGFFELLEIACSDYLIVVGLDREHDQHILRYESPIRVQVKRSTERLRSFVPVNLNAYRIDYTSKLPPTLKSYHLVFEAEDDVVIEGLYLSTDSERNAAQTLAADLKNCAERMDENSVSPLTPVNLKYLEVEAQSAIRSSSEMLRRRAWEASLVRERVDIDAVKNLQTLSNVTTSGEVALSPEGHEVSSVLRHPLVTPHVLRAAAEELGRAEVGMTLAASEGPPSPQSHTYWRRNAELRSEKRPVTVEGRCVLRDGGESRPQRLILYSAGMSLLAWGVASLLAKGVWPVKGVSDFPPNRDALVAVLLLVPGFLYSKLDLGRRGSVAAQLRRLSRYTALVGVASAAAAATAVAASYSLVWINFMLTLAVLTPLVSGAFLILRARFWGAKVGLSELSPAPWIARPPAVPRINPDVVVTSVFAGSEG